MIKVVFKILGIIALIIFLYLGVYLLLCHFSVVSKNYNVDPKELDALEIDFPKEYVCLHYEKHDGERITIYRDMVFYSAQQFTVSNLWRQPFPSSTSCDRVTLGMLNERLNKEYKIDKNDVIKHSQYDRDDGVEMRMDVLETTKGYYMRIEIIKN